VNGVRFQFGDCTFDRDTRELWRGGKTVHVEPKALRLLELLLENRPKALSKQDLQEVLWPKTFVSERSLARLVADLRTALGEGASEARFIRTLHGFGYAFSGDVVSTEPPRAAPIVSDVSFRLIWGEREVALAQGDNILGREPDALVWIDSGSVSRRHARILVEGERATLEDLGSKNGTFLDGRKIDTRVPLSNGSQIKVGSASLVFRCFRRTGTTETEVES